MVFTQVHCSSNVVKGRSDSGFYTSTLHFEGSRQASQTAAAKSRRPTTTPDGCGANSNRRPVANVDMAVKNKDELIE